MRRTRALLALILLVLVASVTAAVGGVVDPPPTLAFVARGDVAADALAAGPIAGRAGAPVLLTPPDVLSDTAASELTTLEPDIVVLAGGEAALSSTVEQQIADLLPDATVRRASGQDRYETAAQLAALIREYRPAYLTPADADDLAAMFAPAVETTTRRVGCGPLELARYSDGGMAFEQSGPADDYRAYAAHTGGAGAINRTFCPLDLPAGAVITDAVTWFIDNGDSGGMSCGVFPYLLDDVTGSGSKPADGLRMEWSLASGNDTLVEVHAEDVPLTVPDPANPAVTCQTTIVDDGGIASIVVTYEVPAVPGTR